jgi:choline dehydrogenase-like flavoprotein
MEAEGLRWRRAAVIIDARSIPVGTKIETDVCIIGAGAAGITLAREFIGTPFRVVLLESGGVDFDPDTQQLYDGQSIGRPFPTLMTSRLRFFGGTTNHWGGWCLPLDPIDFEPRDEFPHHGWPFAKSDLDPYYRRAQEVCRLGPYDYRPASWGIRPSEIPGPFAGPDFESRVLQVNALRFGPVYGPQLRRAPRVVVYLYANAFHLDGGENDAEVKELSVKTLTGNQFTVHARHYVMAAGAIENARLLLASGRSDGKGLGNQHDLVGRFFMVHLEYSGGIIVPSSPYTNFDFQTAGEYGSADSRHSYATFVGLSAAAMLKRHLPNIFLHWGYRFSPVMGSLKALKRIVAGEGPGGSLLSDLSVVIGHIDGVTNFAVRKVLFGEGVPVEALNLACVSEQQPNPQSRVLLGAQLDALGMREIVVDWQLAAEDQRKAAATVRLLGLEIGRAGFGRLRGSFNEGDAWPPDLTGNEHHMGTTRMHVDPALGVVDQDCRVHGIANLYVAGSSVFPTGGANNPTLTIVALALRLADHLKTTTN